MRWLILLALLLTLTGCNLFHDTLTVIGRVNDTQGTILEGVDITAEGVTSTTNEKGYYRLWNIIIDGLVDEDSAKIAFDLYYEDYGYYRYIRDVSVEDPRMDFTLDKEFASAAPLNKTVDTEMIIEQILKEKEEERKILETKNKTDILPQGGAGGGGGEEGLTVPEEELPEDYEDNETFAPIENQDESNEDIYVNASDIQFEPKTYFDDEDHFGLESISFSAYASRSSSSGIAKLELRTLDGTLLDDVNLRFSVVSGDQTIEIKDEEGQTDDIEYLRTNYRGQAKLHINLKMSNENFYSRVYDILLGVDELPVQKEISLELEEASANQPMVEEDPNVTTMIYAHGDISIENNGNTPIWGRCIRRMYLDDELIGGNETSNLFYVIPDAPKTVDIGITSYKVKPQLNGTVRIEIEFIDDDSESLAEEEYDLAINII